jgi:6-pyruvoyltetrahydropterin/6-carboxytetrahydropterin synthase
MIATFKEFSFEAAHAIPPHSSVHGHSFLVRLEVTGVPDSTFGWPASLYDIETEVETLRAELDHCYLNDIEGLAVPSLENLAGWIWERLSARMPGLATITISRGLPGQAEGCTYRGIHEGRGHA